MDRKRDECVEQRGEPPRASAADTGRVPPPVVRARVVSHTRTTVHSGIDRLGQLAAQRRAARPRNAPTHETKACNPGEGRGPLRPKDDCSTRRG